MLEDAEPSGEVKVQTKEICNDDYKSDSSRTVEFEYVQSSGTYIVNSFKKGASSKWSSTCNHEWGVTTTLEFRKEFKKSDL